MMPISDGIVLAFFDFLKRHRMEIDDLRGIRRSDYAALVDDFNSKVDGLVHEDVDWLRSDSLYQALINPAGPAEVSVFTPLQKWSGGHWATLVLPNDLEKYRDDFHRFYSINNHILFFATEADEPVKEYILRYLNELHEQSADFADIYFVVGEEGSWDQGYRLKRTLKSITGIDSIRNSDFPCMFLWSDRSHLLLRLSHLQSKWDTTLLTAYIRQVFDILEIRNRPLDEQMKFEIQELPLSVYQRESLHFLDIPLPAPVDFFVSYKREDREKIELLVRGLEGEGYRTWFDSGIMAGEPFRNVIEAYIQVSRGVMPVWSSKSIRSPFVQGEAAAGSGKLLPVKIEAVKPLLDFGELHTLDLVGWDGSYVSKKWEGFKEDVARWLRERSIRQGR